MKKIIYMPSDGGVCIVTPQISVNDPVSFTEDDALQRALDKDVPRDALNVQVVETLVLPADRRKRAAWRLTGSVIDVDELKWLQLYNMRAISQIDSMDRVQFEHLFDLENRTRVLELKLPITRQQYRDVLIARWKTLTP